MTGDSFILDTNVVIDLFKGSQDIADKIDASDSIFLPLPVLGELYFGAENSQRKAYHLSEIIKFLQIVVVLDTDAQTAQVYGKIKAFLKKKGTPIPENDIWIAALAQQHQLPLVTQDQHFNHVNDLQILSW